MILKDDVITDPFQRELGLPNGKTAFLKAPSVNWFIIREIPHPAKSGIRDDSGFGR
jgi:hypothetical protein